jgi:hypothetical protein
MQIPFQAASGATVGNTVAVVANNTPTSVAGSITATGSWPTILVTNSGSVTVFVRLSAQATPVATAADIPVLAGAQVVLSNPVAFGTCGVAALSITTTQATVYFTPGIGGI